MQLGRLLLRYDDCDNDDHNVVDYDNDDHDERCLQRWLAGEQEVSQYQTNGNIPVINLKKEQVLRCQRFGYQRPMLDDEKISVFFFKLHTILWCFKFERFSLAFCYHVSNTI